MKVKQLDHLNLTVRNFEETVAWYGRIFGFEKVEENFQDGVHWGVLRSGDALLCVYENADAEFVDRFAARERGIHALAHFALRITDVEEWLATARREDLKINYGGEVEWPNSRAWYVSDPTGWEIEVVHWQNDEVKFLPLAG